MKRNRKELEVILDKKFNSEIDTIEFYKKVNEFNLETNIASLYLNGIREMHEADERILYILSYSLGMNTDDWFTEREVKEFSKKINKYKAKKDLFTFDNVIKVSDDQYLTTIDIETWKAFKHYQLINYNTSIQRPVRAKLNGDKVVFKINVNEKAVREIKSDILSGLYVPDTITLNVDNPFNLIYDKESHTLSVIDTESYDILDGYHRYRALSEIINENPDFEYTMELRITAFSEEKARSFTFQQDKKNKMKKVDAKALDDSSVQNIIIDRLNRSPKFDLRGNIGVTGYIIPSWLGIIIDAVYLSEMSAKEKKENIETIKQNICDTINDINQINRIDYTLKFEEICAAVMMSKYGISADKFSECSEKIKKLKLKKDKISVNNYNRIKEAVDEFI